METNGTSPTIFVDNVSATLAQVAQYLLDNTPVEHTKHALEDLKMTVRGERKHNYLRIEFKAHLNDGSKHGVPASCDLAISLPDTWDRDLVEDGEGNIWSVGAPSIQVGWPTWGSSNLEVTRFRLNLMNAVTKLAEDLAAILPSQVMEMVRTAAQVKEAEEAREKQAQEVSVKMLVEANRNRMRVAQERPLNLNDSKTFDSLPNGTWTVKMMDDKEYSFIKTTPTFAVLTRLS